MLDALDSVGVWQRSQLLSQLQRAVAEGEAKAQELSEAVALQRVSARVLQQAVKEAPGLAGLPNGRFFR